MTCVNLLLGVVKREFLLSTQPVEGDWKISVTAAEVRKSVYLYAILMKDHFSKIEIPIIQLLYDAQIFSRLKVRFCKSGVKV